MHLFFSSRRRHTRYWRDWSSDVCSSDLRDGSYRLLYGIGSEGIIAFPSLHAAFALVLVAAFWPVPVLRWLGLAINTVMLISTPVDGAHYLSDLIAGLAVAALAIVAARRFAAQSMQLGSSADDR